MTLKDGAKKAIPVAVTALVLIAALFVLRHLWRYYMEDPWTRDAHLTADVVQVAPDVSGPVVEVKAHDNAAVHRGDALFVIDPERYRLALAQAQGALAQRQAALAQGLAALGQSRAALAQAEAAQRQLEREAVRDSALKDLVAAEEIEARRASLERAQASVAAARAGIAVAVAGVDAARANVAAAQSAVELAQLNLARTVVRSPVDGQVNDRTVRQGDYVAAGKAVLAVLDTTSFRVDGYFEETRLRHVRAGQPVEIRVMGESGVLRGHVQSIAAGIEDRYRTSGASLLPNVTPAFDWVRLAQRVPVRIRIDRVPDGMQLIAGRTATVNIVGEDGRS